MSPRYWIGVAHSKQAEAARMGGFCAFSHGKESAVRRLGPGDMFVYYAPKTDFDGDPVQAFVQLGRVTDSAPVERLLPGTDFRPWTRGATYEDVREVPVRPMLESFGFIRSPRHWGMAFRRSLFEIPQTDFELIAAAMRGTA
ncbi:EVE domain-containing protein [Actibacterium sp. XHP0104]|uniref:EVE domain-containing protein n=1 Tax=Actibacterium sp. XHP0104 TaxID=2984335 RepID=UPI0021E71999|nr:EVE domain-containing protein [Actibacterium sp. XHP0104]MCV2882356.1 EVE domain-containing protein [Actibacterium sp. XHP0104]